MNITHLTLRSLCKADVPAVEGIIRKTWNYDSLSDDPKDAAHMARLYLRACLKRATFSRVAVADGRVLGLILADSRAAAPRCSLCGSLAELEAIARLFTTKRGRQIGAFFHGVDGVDAALLEDCGRTFDGEICFFAMDEAARGLGVGKELFGAAVDYLKGEGAQNFYLFTDTSCTYQFYEKRGMERLAQRVLDLRPKVNYQLHMFLYSYELT